MAEQAASQRNFLRSAPVLLLKGCGLYFIYHFPLMPAYSLLGAVWRPLALLVPGLLFLVLFGHERWLDRCPPVRRAGAALYTGWLIAFCLAVMALQWLIDWRMVVGLSAAALIAGGSVGGRRARIAPVILIGCLAFTAWHEPYLIASRARLFFGIFLATAVGALFLDDAPRRFRRIDFAALVLLAPSIFSLAAFYRGPAGEVPADPAVRFRHAGDAAAAPHLGAGRDLREAVFDCDGALLLGSSDIPGLQRIADGTVTVLDEAPAGDNLDIRCGAEASVSYGTRIGEVVWRTEVGVTRRQLGEPILMVAGRETPTSLYAMGNKGLLALLTRPELAVQAQRGGGEGFFGALRGSGVNIDLFHDAENKALYRSVMLRGVEKLDPDSLATIGRYPLPASVGGTLALDAAGGRLFVADWLGTRITILDAGDLRLLGRLQAPRGVRRLVYDPARRLLLAGSYFTGEVLIYESGDERPWRRLPVGRRVRGLTLTGDRCLGVSAAGVFEIDLNALNPAPVFFGDE